MPTKVRPTGTQAINFLNLNVGLYGNHNGQPRHNHCMASRLKTRREKLQVGIGEERARRRNQWGVEREEERQENGSFGLA